MKKKQRYFNFQDLVLFILALFFLLIIFVGVLAVSFPETARQTADNVAARFSEAFNAGPNSRTLQKRADEGYTARLKPIVTFLARSFRSGRQSREREKISFAAGACIKCHKDIFDRLTFNQIRVDHRLHEAVAVDCNACHADIEHPAPAAVVQETCIDCHKRDGGPVRKCGACHPPGTILASASAKNLKEFMSGARAGDHSLVPEGFGHPVGDLTKTCDRCHNRPKFCTKCHGMARDRRLVSPHDANWRDTHGPRVMQRNFTIVGCANCHKNALYCAGTCHPNPGRERRNPQWPVPRKKL